MFPVQPWQNFKQIQIDKYLKIREKFKFAMRELIKPKGLNWTTLMGKAALVSGLLAQEYVIHVCPQEGHRTLFV